jgi:hypothetical protein
MRNSKAHFIMKEKYVVHDFHRERRLVSAINYEAFEQLGRGTSAEFV